MHLFNATNPQPTTCSVVCTKPFPLAAVRRQANQRGKVAPAPVDGAPMGVGASGGGSGGNGDDDMPKKKVRLVVSGLFGLDPSIGPSVMSNAQFVHFLGGICFRAKGW